MIPCSEYRILNIITDLSVKMSFESTIRIWITRRPKGEMTKKGKKKLTRKKVSLQYDDQTRRNSYLEFNPFKNN